MAWTKMLWKMALACALAGGFLFVSGGATVRAADLGSCRRNVEKWESRLNYDMNHHGVYSRQANHDRHELAAAREYCARRYGYRW